VFYIGVAKIDRDIAHAAMTIHVCFKCMFQLFHLFQTHVANVSSGCGKSRSECSIYIHVASICFKCFRLLQTYVSSVSSECCIYFCNGYTCVFPGVSNICCKCFSYFRRMLLVFHLNVAKINRVLYMLQWDLQLLRRRACAWEAEGWSAVQRRA
jgi:hypothetical protein